MSWKVEEVRTIKVSKEGVEMETTKINTKNQITLPKSVREAMGVQAGDRVGFVLNNGEVKVVPIKKREPKDLMGTLRTNKPITDIKHVRQQRVKYLAKKFTGSKDSSYRNEATVR